MHKKYTILIIDDKDENLHYLNNILKNYDYNIRATTDPSFALTSSQSYPPDLILLDIKMPNIDGFEVCKLFKENDKLKDIPIIFISAIDDIEIKVKAFEQGGVDYITKPFEKEEVLARIKTQLKIFENNQTILSLLQQQDFFLKKIIHEMNTPLSIISLNVDNLERQLGPKEQFEAIKASSKSLSSIYNDLYYLTKKQTMQKNIKAINLVNFLSSRIIFFDEIAKTKNIILDLEISDEFDVLMDEYEFERIIDNTLSNAIKYSFENTIVVIALKNYQLEVINEGIKIKDTSLVFEKYYQEKVKNIGLGLGLNIVKSICDNYAIKIEILSDEVTTFKYIFPQNLIKEGL
ncbi:response regulator receiver sensor signal transduction histidine kinase [Arcobacter nitrofigilis DSM 7299]|uniref:histidine kinase n=1 Tax=Arcobacter nitrofigilis (strain ATCC 33309 / DSM 7299 / CCUG 15893 / LMG 7604 / NCTC 12251 / CI) TaxID=572480 RepID=D5V3D3_ARCNC|nr:hybrid sensor histidine kinase/response regulator [Arcobacter nitrofigilis]ADG92715.1 response regulator receiver sensor signal transduction histidine kinase [Arcobacter nitrofigilis DSM 7299]